MNQRKEFEIVEGSMNVYADLGYPDTAEMQRESQLTAEIALAIKGRRLTQDEAAELVGIDQSKCRGSPAASFGGSARPICSNW